MGPILPTSNVRYPTSTIDCSGNTVPVTIRTATTLGVMCQISSTEEFYYHGDLLVECNELSHDFEIAFDKYGFSGERYVCSESVTFPIGSSISSTQIVPSVVISTDEYWLQDPTGCYTVEENTFTSTTTPITSPPVTVAPTFATAVPSVMNSQSPTTTVVSSHSPTTVVPTSMVPSFFPTKETIPPSVVNRTTEAPHGALSGVINDGTVRSSDNNPSIVDNNNCTTSSLEVDNESGRDLRNKVRRHGRHRRNRSRDPCKRRCRDRPHCRNFFISSTVVIGLIATYVMFGPQQCIAGVVIMILDGIIGWLILG